MAGRRYGALFIKLFGFSFVVLRAAMLLIGMATVYFMQQVLVGFGIARWNAALGALTLGLSPIFLQLTTTFMTDVPGVLFIVVCVYMCQRAVGSVSQTGAMAWLVSATVVNLAGGTVRQTTWLGALVMVPATAWMLRRQRGMVQAGIALGAASVVSVVLMMHWCATQPYFIQVGTFGGGRREHLHLGYLTVQTAKPLACLLLLTLPVVLVWILRVSSLSARKNLVGLGFLTALVVTVLWLARGSSVNTWLMPWLYFNLYNLGASDLPLWFRWLFSVLAVASGIALAEQLWEVVSKRKILVLRDTERTAFWILGPFTLMYMLFLVPSVLYAVFDRYLLALMVSMIVLSLVLYERLSAEFHWRRFLPAVCTAVLVLYAGYAMMSIHDGFAASRAVEQAIQVLQDAGIPRTQLTAGMGSDAWVQVNLSGHVNDPGIKVPAGTYKTLPTWGEPPECRQWHYYLLPDFHPRYILQYAPTPCFAPSPYAPVQYRTWLPPYQREIYIDRMP